MKSARLEALVVVGVVAAPLLPPPWPALALLFLTLVWSRLVGPRQLGVAGLLLLSAVALSAGGWAWSLARRAPASSPRTRGPGLGRAGRRVPADRRRGRDLRRPRDEPRGDDPGRKGERQACVPGGQVALRLSRLAFTAGSDLEDLAAELRITLTAAEVEQR